MLHRRRALLFDAGELHALSSGHLVKVTHVFLTHAHMDHIIGFDHLVRVMLRRGRSIRVYGPAPLGDHLASRLGGYCWNLVEGAGGGLLLEVFEVDGDRIWGRVLDCGEGFRDPGRRDQGPFRGVLCREPGFQVRAAVLDHGIPVLAYLLEEPRHLQVLKGSLERFGLRPGPWLGDLKEAVLRRMPQDYPIPVSPPQRGPLPLGWLQERILRERPGQKIAYVCDARDCEANRRRIVELAQGADLLYIEAAFLEEDRERAEATAHLTAWRAGRLAAEAGVCKVVPFHLSPKYASNPEQVTAQVERAFRVFT
jgi:ribonuclease Z